MCYSFLIAGSHVFVQYLNVFNLICYSDLNLFVGKLLLCFFSPLELKWLKLNKGLSCRLYEKKKTLKCRKLKNVHVSY